MIRAGMRVRIDSADRLEELKAFLVTEAHVAVQQLSPEELEVSLFGSYSRDAMRAELYLRLRAWEADARGSGARVEIVE